MGVWALGWVVFIGKTVIGHWLSLGISQLGEGQSLQGQHGPRMTKHQKCPIKSHDEYKSDLLITAELTKWVRNGFRNILEGEEMGATRKPNARCR